MIWCSYPLHVVHCHIRCSTPARLGPVNLLSDFTTSSLLSHKKDSCNLTESIALIPLYPEGE